MPTIKPKGERANFGRLASAIISCSESDDWEDAKLEWSLEDVFYAESDEPGTCLCGHHPIIELCVLRNRITDAEVIVGNVCVQQFMGIDTDKLFRAIARISQEPNRSLNALTVDYAHRRGWIIDWARKFYLDILRKRKLSVWQRANRVEINEQVLFYFSRRGRRSREQN